MVKSTFLAFLIAAVAASVNSASDSTPSESFREDADWLELHVVGKTCGANIASIISDGMLETELQRETMYMNRVRTEATTTFDAIILILQKLYGHDSSGKRITDEPLIKNCVLALRHSTHAQKATGEAIGASETLTTSLEPTPPVRTMLSNCK